MLPKDAWKWQQAGNFAVLMWSGRCDSLAGGQPDHADTDGVDVLAAAGSNHTGRGSTPTQEAKFPVVRSPLQASIRNRVQYTCSRWFVIIPQMKHASSRAVAVTASGLGFRTAMDRYFRFIRSFPLFAYAITLGSLPAWRFKSSEDVLPGKERA